MTTYGTIPARMAASRFPGKPLYPIAGDPMLAVPITDETLYKNPGIVKSIHDLNGNVLYTSRELVLHCREFFSDLGAMRVGCHVY